MHITLLSDEMGYLIRAEDGRDLFLQFESDLFALASNFGWQESVAESPYGVVRDFLDDRAGTSIEDPGYFD
jgi:hypothetical protein